MAEQKLTEVELMEFARSTLPARGTTMSYSDWAAAIKASPHPEAINMYRKMKRLGYVSASISHDAATGKLSHTITRAGE